MTEFDPSKPVQTRDGRPARIICTDKKGDAPVLGLIAKRREEELMTYAADGVALFTLNHGYDLINIPETHEVVVYLHKIDGYDKVLLTNVSGGAIASERVTFTEGKFAEED